MTTEAMDLLACPGEPEGLQRRLEEMDSALLLIEEALGSPAELRAEFLAARASALRLRSELTYLAANVAHALMVATPADECDT